MQLNHVPKAFFTFQNSTSRHFENRRGEDPGDEVVFRWIAFECQNWVANHLGLSWDLDKTVECSHNLYIKHIIWGSSLLPPVRGAVLCWKLPHPSIFKWIHIHLRPQLCLWKIIHACCLQVNFSRALERDNRTFQNHSWKPLPALK